MHRSQKNLGLTWLLNENEDGEEETTIADDPPLLGVFDDPNELEHWDSLV